MKILIIDDQKVPAENLKLAIDTEFKGGTTLTHDMFDTAFDRVEQEMPDVVVLDIFADPNLEDNEGDKVRAKLWERHFCPLIIYTAKPLPEHAELAKHPFVRLHAKTGSSESDEQVVRSLGEFAPHVEVLHEVRREVAQAMGNSLRDVCEVIWQDSAPETRGELVGRITRRRIAASMDIVQQAQTALRPWEQYVYPSLSPDLMTGDVLRRRGAEGLKSEDFLVVLSPSCDLVRNRKGCLQRVLVAQCESPQRFVDAANLAGAGKPKLKRRLPSFLTADQVNGVFCLPELPKIIPAMAVDLKNLQLLDMVAVSLSEDPNIAWYRIASVDSPFRERISWAFAQISGRPGLPTIDNDQFVDVILEQLPADAPAEA
jgi:hypothetical protein